MSAPVPAILEVRDLRVELLRSGQRVPIVHGLSFKVDRGKTLAIVGESGSGKTVSCRALMALLPDTAIVTGSIRFAGEELVGLGEPVMRGHRGSGMAMVFQDPARSLNPTMRIGDQITEAVREHRTPERTAARQIALELMRMMQLDDPERLYDAYPHQLSGGMQQRVMIATAIAGHPKVLIADEPTRALDVTTQAQILRLLRGLQRQLGMAIIMVSHDLLTSAAIADDLLVMHAGRTAEYGAAGTVFARARMPYTRALLAAIPRLDQAPRTAFVECVAQGAGLSVAGSGCPFHRRCDQALHQCELEAPQLREHTPGHWWACWQPGESGSPS